MILRTSCGYILPHCDAHFSTLNTKLEQRNLEKSNSNFTFRKKIKIRKKISHFVSWIEFDFFTESPLLVFPLIKKRNKWSLCDVWCSVFIHPCMIFHFGVFFKDFLNSMGPVVLIICTVWITTSSWYDLLQSD